MKGFEQTWAKWATLHEFATELVGYAGVQSINNVYANVNKVENVLVYTHNFDLIDIGVYVVYALYSSTYLRY
jgi:hypothetical protein